MSAAAPLPVCLWSGPRNVSTALMYSFAELPNVRIVDEPLYGHYLRVTNAPHPGREAVLATMNCDGAAVIESMFEQQRARPDQRLFLKHMAHHLVDLDLDFLERTCNVLLVRDPVDMLPSLVVQLPHATLTDTGLKTQWQLFERLRDAGQPPVVVDSRELLTDPAAVLKQLCAAISIRYSDAMLSWPAGARAEDGVWAPHWYHAVHQSTGFAPYRPKGDFPAELETLLAECQPWYDRLYEHAIKGNGSPHAST